MTEFLTRKFNNFHFEGQELVNRIITQIEYYFSDENLKKDYILDYEIKSNSGWVSLETLITFNRLKALTTDFDEIIDALKKSSSGLLEIDEKNYRVRRTSPLPDTLLLYEIKLRQNSVHVNGFPTDYTYEDLKEFFERFGPIENIFMRRQSDRKMFKGSVYVVFESRESKQNFLKMPEIKCEDKVLSKQTVDNYSNLLNFIRLNRNGIFLNNDYRLLALVDDLDKKIIRQIEFYFSDFNIRQDMFMKQQLYKDSGWVQLEIFLKSNRVENLSTDTSHIVSCIKRSQLLQYDEVKRKLRLIPNSPHLVEFEKELKRKTVFVKGFPDYLSKSDLYSFFENYGNVMEVFMRALPNKEFMGDAFITFHTLQIMRNFLRAGSYEFEGHKLSVQSLLDYDKSTNQVDDSIKMQIKQEKLRQKLETEKNELKFLCTTLQITFMEINRNITKHHIAKFFDQYGIVEKVKFISGQIQAYVRFIDGINAEEVVCRIKNDFNGALRLEGTKFNINLINLSTFVGNNVKMENQ